MTQKLLSRREAVTYLAERWGIRRTLGTLGKYASCGGGPVFRRVGRHPHYTPADLDAWAEKILGPLMRTTSELAEQQKADDGAVS